MSQFDKAHGAVILFDLGTEAGFSTAPAAVADRDATEEEGLFPLALVVGDHGHAMHHVMLEMERSYTTHGVWKQLHAVAKYFSSRARLEHFLTRRVRVVMVDISAEEAKLWRKACPTLARGRWEYVHEVLRWLLPRRRTLMQCWFLKRRGSGRAVDINIVTREEEALVWQACRGNMKGRFWVAAEHLRLLSGWGASVVGWLRGCTCHEELLRAGQEVSCALKGRRAPEWAATARRYFTAKLWNLVPPLPDLHTLDPIEVEIVKALLAEFEFYAAFRCWGELPWSMVRM